MSDKNSKFNYEQAVGNLFQSYLKSLEELDRLEDDLTEEELKSLGEIVENMEEN